MSVVQDILYSLFILIQVIVAFYLINPFVLVLLYLIKRIFRIESWVKKKQNITNKNFDFALIITAHTETKFIPPLVDSILRQVYSYFHVYIVADNCDTSTLNFDDSRIKVLHPERPLNAKTKSIDFAFAHFTKEHDAVVIIDADNLIHPNFLKVMNEYLQKGFKAVQADFKPKNIDTHYARMDAIGDMFNFFLEREMRMELGLSASIWGSGVAIDTKLYKEVIYHNHLGGFDKKLQAHVVKRVPVIAFAKEAILYDEKISSGKALEKQRTRWIYAQFKYFKENFSVLVAGLKQLNFNLFYFGLIVIKPPLFLTIGSALLFTIINFFISKVFFICWLTILGLFVLSFFAIIAIKGKDIRFFYSVFLLPIFMFRQLLALFKIKKASTSFLRTEHTKVVYINDVIRN